MTSCHVMCAETIASAAAKGVMLDYVLPSYAAGDAMRFMVADLEQL